MTDWGRPSKRAKSNLGEINFHLKLMRVASDGRAAVTDKEIQVRTQVCLQDVLDVEPNPAPIRQCWRLPLRAAARQCNIVNIQA